MRQLHYLSTLEDISEKKLELDSRPNACQLHCLGWGWENVRASEKWVCLCVIGRERETETEKEREREIDRQREVLVSRSLSKILG